MPLSLLYTFKGPPNIDIKIPLNIYTHTDLMPTATHPQQTAARPVTKPATQKTRASAPAKKKRVVRRRGRARGELDSDDEIEREAATDDSDSDNGDLSSNSSATDDSDTEPASEDVLPHDRTHLPTPRNSKSPESVLKDEGSGEVPSFFAPSGNWSEMVADEKVNGPADLPVIDFAELGSLPAQKTAGRKSKKATKANRQAESKASSQQPPHEDAAPPKPDVDATASESKRPPQRQSLPSQSARQLYQQKLETDPSFVPTIGNFWGHDDRLIDTELRSLSGWWRGRGGRGRARGGFGGRGRGGFNGPPHLGVQADEATTSKESDLPPVERTWTHDGFEEMKKKEELRRTEAAARQPQASPKRGGFVGAARGGFVPGRGRGGFMRGGFASPVGARGSSPFSPAANRVRFVMKPELMWTKQHEAFLYFDTTLKPRQGQGAGFRIKIPGHQQQVIRAAPGAREAPKASSSKVTAAPKDDYIVVNLPKRAGKEREVAEVSEKDIPLEEVFTVRPDLATKPDPLPETSTTSATSIPQEQPTLPSASESSIRSQLENLSLDPTPPDPERQAKTEQAVMRKASTDDTVEVQPADVSPIVERPILHPLQTAFTPPPPPPPQPMSQPSPAYGSPYGYPVPLPMGIAMNPHGMPYEVATGRPVYLQPPPTMYNPRPMIPSHLPPGMPFVPGHMHHHSSVSVSAVSPDFLSQPPSHTHTPPMNGFIDPTTGTPIFSFPRQTSRIEIRAPGEEAAAAATTSKPLSAPKSVPRTPSGLRTAAPTFQPSSNPRGAENGYYQASTPSDVTLPSYEAHAHGHGHSHGGSMEDASAMMAPYPQQHYQNPYYYPEPYGYPQYVDISQPGQYDMYAVEQPPQGTVYY